MKKNTSKYYRVALENSHVRDLFADDWLDSHAIEILSNTLEKNKRIGMVFPDYYEVNSNGKITKLVRNVVANVYRDIWLKRNSWK